MSQQQPEFPVRSEMKDEDIENMSKDLVNKRLLAQCVEIIRTVDQLTPENVAKILKSSEGVADLFKTVKMCRSFLTEIILLENKDNGGTYE